MSINFPAHIVIEGFSEGVGFLADIDSNMMFKASSAYILHEGLQIMYLHYTVAAQMYRACHW